MERASIIVTDLDLANVKISKMWLILLPVLIVILGFLVKQTGWKTYQSPQSQFSIKYPNNWQVEAADNMVELIGPEGKVLVATADSFGGGNCDGFAGKLVNITTKNQTATVCNRSFEQSEVWIGSCNDCRQIKSADGNTSFDLSAQTNGISPSKRQLIMQILSTFTFSN